MTQKESSFAEKITPVLVVIVVGLAFLTGSLWQKVNSLGGGNTNTGTNQAAQPSEPQAPYVQMSEEEASEFLETSAFNYGEEHVRGNRDAEVFLVEYSDLECPFCSSFHSTANQVVEEYGDRVGWLYRHFPLDSIHPNARPAALGAECVASLGGNDAFWNFADEVFSNQQTAFTRLPEIAAELGIDRGAYETCVSSGSFADVVESNYQTGLDTGVTGTPGNFLVNRDGEVWTIYGSVPYATLKQAVEEALN
jgi:protein-disulfide isomerase